jgi:hypothetical protein
MPYCPKCRCEYREDVEICPDCDIELIDILPPEIPEEYEDAEWVELYSFPGSLYARMAIEMLTLEGIPSYCQSYFGGTALSGGSGADYPGATASVFVLEPDLEHGRNVIEPMIDELPTSINEDDEEEE